MQVNFFEYCVFVNEQASEFEDVWYQLNFTPPKVAMNFFRAFLDNKKGLIDYRDQVLDNVANKFNEIRESNDKLLNTTFELQQKAFLMRQNLELSVLMSKIKAVEIEMQQLKAMNAETFINKYGA